ncbi:MAG: hypothetical protein AB7K52_02145 [Phycisphaerales bacterium]
METAAHRALKVIACEWLRRAGCVASAVEVRCPISRYRVDAAGYADSEVDVGGVAAEPGATVRAPAPRRGPGRGHGRGMAELPALGATVFVECKATRADFLRDNAERPRLLARRARLQAELDRVTEEFVKPGEPELRESGTYLFAALEQWSLERARSPAYRAIVRELRRIDAALHGQTKFFMLAHYRLAERLLLLTPPGLVEAPELPRHWGLLVAERPEGARLIVEPARLDSPELRRLRVLRNVAAAASRAARGGFSDGPSSRDAGPAVDAATPLPTPIRDL